jgi:hypothetical protein
MSNDKFEKKKQFKKKHQRKKSESAWVNLINSLHTIWDWDKKIKLKK